MYISKPNTPEELYQFFIKGMPLKPINLNYGFDFRRKGWNLYTYRVDAYNKEFIQLEFYTAISAYYPDWILEAFKHVDIKTN